MSKAKATYNPDAIDKDGDGVIQEGTEFERPVGTDLENVALPEPVEAEDAVEEPETVLETPKPLVEGNVWVADESVSYAVLAARFLPDGWKKHAYAVHLYEINKGKPVNAGTQVKL